MADDKTGGAEPRNLMKPIFLALVGGLVAYELVALSEKRKGDTISEITWSTSSHYTILPFAAGVLCGHFFWQRSQSAASPSSSAGLK